MSPGRTSGGRGSGVGAPAPARPARRTRERRFRYLDSLGAYLAIRDAGIRDIHTALVHLGAGPEAFDDVADGLHLYRTELADDRRSRELDVTRSAELRGLETVSRERVAEALRAFDRGRS